MEARSLLGGYGVEPFWARGAGLVALGLWARGAGPLVVALG